jgi:hypothetical protein
LSEGVEHHEIERLEVLVGNAFTRAHNCLMRRKFIRMQEPFAWGVPRSVFIHKMLIVSILRLSISKPMINSRSFAGLFRPGFETFGGARLRSVIPGHNPVTARARLIRFFARARIGGRRRSSRKIDQFAKDGGQSLWL